jgi:class 3 adenylate cyclase/tetratricopeptide (TPR) repeat protein
MQPQPQESSRRLSRYLPRTAIAWLAEEPDRPARAIDGSLVFADVSGFTALSERLAKQGRIGAEILADTISACFTRLLAAAYSNGGSLLKFGGDALLLMFTGDDHVRRACHAAIGMRRELRGLGPIDGARGRTRLRMSVGVHTGTIDLFLVGDSDLDLIVTGPAATEVVRMEAIADKGEIVVSSAVAAHLARGCLGEPKGDGLLLRREPAAMLHTDASSGLIVPAEVLARGLPSWLRELALSASDDPQHRLVTVAFLKFSGVDDLLRRNGADRVAEVIGDLVSDVQAAVAQNDVFLLGSDVDKDGGKLLIVGGAPQATGHDEQAVLCAACQIIERERDIQVRIGVNCGPAFAGDIGPSYRRTFSTMGDTVNLAARVMAHAKSGTVMATTAVLERCRTSFSVTAVPPFHVKGKSQPVEAVEVGAVDDHGADTPEIRNAIVGREAELLTIQGAWTEASGGRGQAVVLVGEPGIGKSRLLAESGRISGTEPVAVACAQYDINTPYAAARQLLRRALGCSSDSDDACTERRLAEALAGADEGLRRFAPLLGLVLRVNVPMTREVADLDDRFRRARLEQTVVDLLAQLMPGPSLVTVEDAHWMDEASASLLDRVLTETRRHPWLLCVTRRPVDRGWQPKLGPRVVEVALNPLHPNAAAALAEMLVAEQAHLDPALIDDVVVRAAGNPLFVAELMAGLASSNAADLPDSLEGLINARIDSLAPDDAALLRRLSVLGAAFSHGLARDVLGEQVVPSVQDPVWARLAEFVQFRRGREVEFRHALLMDGAYNSLPFRVREDLHAKVGDRLERDAAGAADDNAEALSLHFHRARRYRKAWRYSRLAAVRAQAMYAHAEAVRFFERAIDAARQAGCAKNADLREAYEQLGNSSRLMGDLRRADDAYRRARQLASADPLVESRLLLKLAGIRQQEGSFAQALRWLHRANQLLDTGRGKAYGRQRAHIAVARASVFKDQDRSRELAKWCQAALADAVRADDKETRAHAAFLLDHAYVRLGQPELAVNSTLALALYEELGDLWGQGSVLNNLGIRAYWAGRWDEAVELYERAGAAYERIGDIGYVGYSRVNVGEIRSDQGRIDEAADLFAAARGAWERIGDRAGLAFVLSNIGRLATRSESFDEAQELLTAARDLAQSLSLPADVLDADLRIVECLCHGGRVKQALALADDVAPRVPPHSFQSGMLARLTGYAVLQQDNPTDARPHFEVSLVEAQTAEAPYEEGLTLRALAYCDAAVGIDPLPHLNRAEAILSRLGVAAVDEPSRLSFAAAALPAIPAQQTAGSSDTVAS